MISGFGFGSMHVTPACELSGGSLSYEPGCLHGYKDKLQPLGKLESSLWVASNKQSSCRFGESSPSSQPFLSNKDPGVLAGDVHKVSQTDNERTTVKII